MERKVIKIRNRLILLLIGRLSSISNRRMPMDNFLATSRLINSNPLKALGYLSYLEFVLVRRFDVKYSHKKVFKNVLLGIPTICVCIFLCKSN